MKGAAEPLVFPRSMSQRDALLWRLESEPVLRSTIVAIAVFDRAPDAERFDATVERTLATIPRLRQRVVSPPIALSPPMWVEVPELALSRHVRRVRAPRDGSPSALLELAADIAARPFEPNAPLWEFVLVEGLEGGHAALIQKLHHAITDGVGGVLLLREFYDDARETPAAPAPSLPVTAETEHDAFILGTAALLRRLSSGREQLTRGASRLLEEAADPGDAVARMAEELRSILRSAELGDGPLSPLIGERSGHQRLAVFSVSLPSLLAAARSVRARLNDAFVAGMMGGFRLYHQHHDVPLDRLRFAIPMSVRFGDATAGNQISIGRLSLPAGEGDPRKRMRWSRHLVHQLRQESAAEHVELLAGLANLLPAPWAAKIVAQVARSTDCVASCLPGPPTPLYLGGARADALYTFGPTAGAAVNATLFSYRERAQVGLQIDTGAIPDVDRFVRCLKEGFDEVLKLG